MTRGIRCEDKSYYYLRIIVLRDLRKEGGCTKAIMMGCLRAGFEGAHFRRKTSNMTGQLSLP
jgi:hypothetical protein